MIKQTLKYVLLFSTIFISCSSSRVKKNNIDTESDDVARFDDNSPMASPYLKTIVIDPGHGGRDGGAEGKNSSEKEVALAVGLKLRDILRKRLPSCKIVMTRESDITQNVKTKANIANKSKGDLFISIHCNSSDPKAKNQPSGTETFIWGTEKNGNKELAMRENESLFKDKSLQSDANSFKPNDPEKKIYYSLKTRKYFNRSYMLAESIEKEFTKVGRTSRSAKQRTKGIWVLQATAMPSVLVETGFISNPKEEKYLNSYSGQMQLANCIAKAVITYNKALTRTGNKTSKSPSASKKENVQGKSRKYKALMPKG